MDTHGWTSSLDNVTTLSNWILRRQDVSFVVESRLAQIISANLLISTLRRTRSALPRCR
jgi:hypothetical protein